MPIIQFRVNDIRRHIYFSFIPKTGGTALLSFFKSLGGKVFLHDENNSAVGLLKCPTQHMQYALADSILNLERADHTFSIVRDPVERAYSDYLWAHRNYQGTPIPKFPTWISLMLSAYQQNNYILDNHMRPQLQFIGPKIRKIYQYRDNLTPIAIEILRAVGLRPKEKLVMPKRNTAEEHFPRKKQNVHHNTQDDMDYAREIIEDFYAVDYQLLQKSEFK